MTGEGNNQQLGAAMMSTNNDNDKQSKISLKIQFWYSSLGTIGATHSCLIGLKAY